MRTLNTLIIFSILILSTSCRFEEKNDENTDIDKFEKHELFGRWIRTSEIESSENEEIIVNKIDLKDDSTAEIEILDSIGYKTINGNWGINNEQKMGSFSFKSDITLTFDWNDNHRHIILLSVKEINGKRILTAQKGEFEKE